MSAGAARPARVVWLVALVFAGGLHAGAFAYALSRDAHDEPADALGAPAIEISLDLATTKAPDADLPPGPEADASVASSASVEQVVKAEETDLPKEKPTETEDPDRLVAPDAAKPEKQEKPVVKESKAEVATESVASEATAPQHIDGAREAERSAAPAQGIGDSARRARVTWQKELVAHLNRFKRYPAGASRRGVELVVGFTLDRLGHVVAARLQRGSGDPAFDRAALAMMHLADPVPPPPPLVADDGLTFSLPVIFRDRRAP